MPRPPTVAEKTGDWLTAYRAISEELTPPALRAMVALADAAGGPAQITLGVAMAKIAYNNDRTAAIAAAMLTQSGVSRPIITVGDDVEDPLDG